MRCRTWDAEHETGAHESLGVCMARIQNLEADLYMVSDDSDRCRSLVTIKLLLMSFRRWRRLRRRFWTWRMLMPVRSSAGCFLFPIWERRSSNKSLLLLELLSRDTRGFTNSSFHRFFFGGSNCFPQNCNGQEASTSHFVVERLV